MSTIATAEAYPLAWPVGWPRYPHYRESARYQTEFGKAVRDLVSELRRFKATHVVLSSNVPVRNDGLPYAVAGARRFDDPGVAVYFTVRKDPQVIACDRWDHVKDNFRAVGLTVAAMRMIERTGASELLKRAFSGFKALPPAANQKPAWWKVFGVDPKATTVADVDAIYKARARTAHPDVGGSEEAIKELNQARDDARDDLVAGRFL